MTEARDRRRRTHLRPVRPEVLAAFDGVGPKLLGHALPLRPTPSARAVFAADSPAPVAEGATRRVKARRVPVPDDRVKRFAVEGKARP
jgi:hypothetical protein